MTDSTATTTLTIAASGPTFGRRRAPLRSMEAGAHVAALPRRDAAVVAALTVCWVAAFASFWVWWLQPGHVVGWFGLVINSVLLFYLTYLPTYFLILANRLRRFRSDQEVPPLRIAFIVTKAPSEPWDLARATLQAMQSQDFPHSYDVWLCDERPTPESIQWCTANGVRVSSRFGVADYHNPEWPRRTKCKEGNLAYFYDCYGYRNYDVVAQLDCDHVPAVTYLTEMVRPFADPAVGYVAAPSINDSNAGQSWSARGRLHREATFHGPVQLGHSDGLAPSCIGSHYTVRTAALQEIGGIGPELAEDFSTSFLLTSAGWRSVFAESAEAHGEGPRTFAAMITQEFQWSRSLMTLFLDLVPSHLGRLPWALRARFLFALSYYPLLSATTVAGLGLPMIAAVTGLPWVNVNYFEFLARWLVLGLCMLAIVFFLRRRGMLRPADSPLVSWENWIYCFARWPYIALGVWSAVVQKVRPRSITFRVTPKSGEGMEQIRPTLILPYCLVAALFAGAALVGEATTNAYGYIFLCLVGAISYAIVAVAVPVLHALESARSAAVPFLAALRMTAAESVALAVGTAALVLVAVIQYPAYLMALIG
ncbi:glycosyltransferase family 2 protein [Arthrobacter sp. Sr33]